MKWYVVHFGYRTYLTEDPQLALGCLGMEHVEKERVGDQYIWVPKTDEISIESIHHNDYREMTPEEKDDKELQQAKSSAEWNAKQNEALRKQVEELKCQLKVALGGEVQK